MLVRPPVTELLKKVDNRYSLVIMTAKRARQIAEGEVPMTSVDDTSPVSLAVDEIYEDKVYQVNSETDIENEEIAETSEENNAENEE